MPESNQLSTEVLPARHNVVTVVLPDDRPGANGDHAFVVLLGADYAGKSSTMSQLAGAPSGWELLSTDHAFVAGGYALVSRLRRDVVKEVLPALGREYSPDFMASMLQTAVVHLRDRIRRNTSGRPILVDSYYYKILAKCRLAGVADNPMFAWWRSFPQPRRVVYLEVAPQTAWRRSERGGEANRLEHYGERPDRASFEFFQADLRKLMLEEVRHLPVTVIEEQVSVARTAQAVREVLAHEANKANEHCENQEGNEAHDRR
jgi:thymidylate kinase